ncbi:kinesin light chain [Colletotrichum truncatum]|uniref:Kinesin light chain n=1 Tax=Colletotrichum truncatum TaxID=5467 RepID=A0ACC3YC84_COLTU|nr:kinesin light chain [Colletotrichum truncatum]KAF6793872.1 kinesin light chain [Colletotrichum truncatum]
MAAFCGSNSRIYNKGSSRALYAYEQETNSSQAVLVPYIKNPDFVERSEVLHQLKLLFGHQKSHGQITQSRSRVALYGLGGIGKTQIALAYVFWLQHVHPDISVFWVHASNAERFYQAYSSIAQECGIPGYDDPQADMLALVKAWLGKESQGRWLMVIDNADDLQLFFPPSESNTTNMHQLAQPQGGFGHYLPECHHGSVLITTRNKQVGSRLVRGKQVIEVKKMVDSETRQLIHAILDDEIPAEDVSLLSTRLEYLPLALAQAAAFMLSQRIRTAIRRK